MNGFGHSSQVIFASLVLNIPEALKYLIAQYAASYPCVFETIGKKRLYALLPSSIRYVRVKNTSWPDGFIFESYDVNSGKIIFRKPYKRLTHHVCVTGQKEDVLEVIKDIASVFVTHEVFCNELSEYAVKCKLSETTSLQLEFRWGLPPSIYFVNSKECYLALKQSKQLSWDFPGETANYVDGWITQLHYFDNQILLITDEAIYMAAYDPLTNVCIQRENWKRISGLPQKSHNK